MNEAEARILNRVLSQGTENMTDAPFTRPLSRREMNTLALTVKRLVRKAYKEGYLDGNGQKEFNWEESTACKQMQGVTCEH
jgi:hypothetical protein